MYNEKRSILDQIIKRLSQLINMFIIFLPVSGTCIAHVNFHGLTSETLQKLLCDNFSSSVISIVICGP